MPEPPILLAKWYDYAKWIIERVDSFPKNQRFIFGQRLAGHALDIMELLVEAAYARDKAAREGREGRQGREAGSGVTAISPLASLAALARNISEPGNRLAPRAQRTPRSKA